MVQSLPYMNSRYLLIKADKPHKCQKPKWHIQKVDKKRFVIRNKWKRFVNGMCFNEMKIKRNMDSLRQITIKTNPLVICYSFNSFRTERSLSYGNLSTDLQSKSMDWFLYDRNLRHKGVKSKHLENMKCYFFHFPSNRKLNPGSIQDLTLFILIFILHPRIKVTATIFFASYRISKNTWK